MSKSLQENCQFAQMSQVIGCTAFNLDSQPKRDAQIDRFRDGVSRKRTTIVDEKGNDRD